MIHDPFSLTGSPHVGAMELRRPPFMHTCARCHRGQTIILPAGPGSIAWRCPCGSIHRKDFGSAIDVLIPQMMTLRLRKPPIENTCDNCGSKDWIVLPKDGGDLRWSCGCGDVWLMRWTPQGGIRSRVRHGVFIEPAGVNCPRGVVHE